VPFCTATAGLPRYHVLLLQFQSAYHVGHSIETAVLKVLTDILLAVDAGDFSTLDLSAAFNMVDHNILLLRIE